MPAIGHSLHSTPSQFLGSRCGDGPRGQGPRGEQHDSLMPIGLDLLEETAYFVVSARKSLPRGISHGKRVVLKSIQTCYARREGVRFMHQANNTYPHGIRLLCP
jgi:hypothetical protein